MDESNRLRRVHLFITSQRLPVAASCVVLAMVSPFQTATGSQANAAFTAPILFACLKELASIANIVAIERNWVIVIAEVTEVDRRVFNARFRRVHLLSKLIGEPLRWPTMKVKRAETERTSREDPRGVAWWKSSVAGLPCKTCGIPLI